MMTNCESYISLYETLTDFINKRNSSILEADSENRLKKMTDVFNYKIDMELIAPICLLSGQQVSIRYPNESIQYEINKAGYKDKPIEDIILDYENRLAGYEQKNNDYIKKLDQSFLQSLASGQIFTCVSDISRNAAKSIIIGNLTKKLESNIYTAWFKDKFPRWQQGDALIMPFAISPNTPIIIDGPNISENKTAKKLINNYLLHLSINNPRASFFLADYNDAGVMYKEIAIAAQTRSHLITGSIVTDTNKFGDFVNTIYAELSQRISEESKCSDYKYIVVSSLPYAGLQPDSWKRFCDLFRQIIDNPQYGLIPLIIFDSTFSHRYSDSLHHMQHEMYHNASKAFYGTLNPSTLHLSVMENGKLTLKNHSLSWIDEFVPTFDDDIATKFRKESLKPASAIETDFFPADYFKESATQGITIPLGKYTNGAYANLSFDANNAFATVAGMNRSGKSTLLRNIIAQLVHRYSPDEIQLYLVDCKNGNQFGIYAKPDYALPHIKKLMLCEDMEYALSIIKELNKEWETRDKIFQRADCQDYIEYRQKGGSMPRLIVIVDEFEHIYTDGSSLKTFAAELGKLYKQCSFAGINLILCSQDITKMFPADLMAALEQVSRRIQLKTLNTNDLEKSLGIKDKTLLFAIDADVRKYSPGSAMYTIFPGSPDKNEYPTFNTLEITNDSLKDRIIRIKNAAKDFPIKTKILIPKNGVPIRDIEYTNHFDTLGAKGLLVGLCPNAEGLLSLNLKKSPNQNVCILGHESNSDYFFRQSLIISMLKSINQMGADAVIFTTGADDNEGRVIRTAKSLNLQVITNTAEMLEKLQDLEKQCDRIQPTPMYLIFSYLQTNLLQGDIEKCLSQILHVGSAKNIFVCFGCEAFPVRPPNFKDYFFHRIYLSNLISEMSDKTKALGISLSDNHALYINHTSSDVIRFRPFIWDEPTFISPKLRR